MRCVRIAWLMPLVMAMSSAAQALPVVEPVDEPAPLVDAARADDNALARALLDSKPRPDVNQHSADGTTALHWAVYHQNVVLAQALLGAGADARVKNDYGATPMSEAAVVGNLELVRKLLSSGADAESANADGQTALMIVARGGNVEAARLLLRRGANVNARERWREQTALMWAAAENQPAMVRFLLEHGADANARSKVNEWERQITSEPRMQARPAGGMTPLLYAARKGCLDCVKALLGAGAKKDLPDPDDVTPLLMSVLNFNFDIAALLVKRGADVDHWDGWGRSALYAAADLNTLPVGGRADRPSSDKTTGLELIDILLDAGADPNLQLKLFPPYRSLRDDRGADGLLSVGTTPLIRAAKSGDLAAMKLLLSHGANPSLPTATGITCLMAAAGNGSTSLDTRGRYKTEAQAIAAVDLLLAAGVDVNAKDINGQTALHGAASWGWNDLVKDLVARNADLMAVDARGRTAADIAKGAPGSSGRATSEPHPATEKLLRTLMASAATPPDGDGRLLRR